MKFRQYHRKANSTEYIILSTNVQKGKRKKKNREKIAGFRLSTSVLGRKKKGEKKRKYRLVWFLVLLSVVKKRETEQCTFFDTTMRQGRGREGKQKPLSNFPSNVTRWGKGKEGLGPCLLVTTVPKKEKKEGGKANFLPSTIFAQLVGFLLDEKGERLRRPRFFYIRKTDYILTEVTRVKGEGEVFHDRPFYLP